MFSETKVKENAKKRISLGNIPQGASTKLSFKDLFIRESSLYKIKLKSLI